MELERFVMTRLDTGDPRVTKADLDEMWRSTFPDSYIARRGRSAFLDGIEGGFGAGDAEGTDLEFRAGGWEIDLSRAATKTVVATAFLGGLLAVLGTAQLPAAVATAVIPLLFDVRRVRLTASEKEILADLVGNAEVVDGKTPDDLYAALSPDIRGQLSRLEFTDFLDSCRRAGLVDEGAGNTIRVRPPDRARFRIALK